jgi:hypothetical protein
MIDENVKIHDKFSVEIKVGFVARKKQKINDFTLNIWTFIPNSLDINRFTYSKENFYRDLTSHIRLITPSYLLRNIADQTIPPFSSLERSFQNLSVAPTRTNKADYEYQLKMFLSILKSSLREEVSHAITSKLDNDRDFLIQSYISNIIIIAQKYRSLRMIINAPSISDELLDYFLFGDEFMANLIESHTFRLVQLLKKRHPHNYERFKMPLLDLIQQGILYKKEKGYLNVEKNAKKNNQELVFRQSMLKKYAESNLFLDVKKSRDGAWTEQILFSLAAGLSMIFATFIAFSFQQKYGSFTMPMFVALVVSYMLKDRIKELSRFYFAHKMNKRYFDHKIKISTHNHEIGWIKESMDFIPERNVPFEVMKTRDRSSILEANNRASSERIILYRTLMQLDRENIDANSEYPIAGVNEILRLNISNLIQKMDDAKFPLYYPDKEEGFIIVPAEKIYYLNLILQIKEGEQYNNKRYRVVFNRKGIQKVETFS